MQLARRRRVRRSGAAAGVLVLALLAGALAFAVTGSSWHSKATVTIVPPQEAGSRAGENPLLQLDYDLPQFVDVLATALRSPSAARTLQRQGGTAPFTADTGDTNPGDTASALTPQLRFVSVSGSAALARRTVTALVLVARDQLDRLQNEADVPGAARATISVLDGPTPAARDLAGRWTAAGRTALVVAVLLGGAGVLVVRRRRPDGAARQQREGVPAPQR